jgi:hypothetical protein
MATARQDAWVASSRAQAPPTPRANSILLAALAIGVLTQLLFYDTGLGINLPIAVGALLLAGWLLRDRARRGPNLADAWLPAAALLLAAFAGLRGDVTLVALDTLGAIGLTGAALASFGGLRVVTRPLADLLTAGLVLAGWATVGAGAALGTLRRSSPARRPRVAWGAAAPVLRGLLIALPLLLIFAMLFSAADAVFSRISADLLDRQIDLGSLPGRVLVAIAAAWLSAGLLTFVTSRPQVTMRDETVEAWLRRPRLGVTEAVTALVALDVLFAWFVALQATYLFGGQDTVAVSGLTYAEYARRGFFELLAVAFGVGGLLLLAEALVARRSRAYLVAFVGLVLLTLVVLASAFLRLRLYQDAYGWTELRFYVLAAIVWLAIGSLLAIAALLSNRVRWLLHAMLGLSIIFGIGFNLIGPVRYVAERNVERVIHPELVATGGESGLDAWYLGTLGDDAVIVMTEALPRLPADARDEVRNVLRDQAQRFAQVGAPSWQAWTYSEARARDLVAKAGLLR